MHVASTCIWCSKLLPIEQFGYLKRVRSKACVQCASWHNWVWWEFERPGTRQRLIEEVRSLELFDRPWDTLTSAERFEVSGTARHLVESFTWTPAKIGYEGWYEKMCVGEKEGGYVRVYGCPVAPHKRSIESVMYELDELKIKLHNPGLLRPGVGTGKCNVCGYHYPMERFHIFRLKGQRVCNACVHFSRGKRQQAMRIASQRNAEIEAADAIEAQIRLSKQTPESVRQMGRPVQVVAVPPEMLQNTDDM